MTRTQARNVVSFHGFTDVFITSQTGAQWNLYCWYDWKQSIGLLVLLLISIVEKVMMSPLAQWCFVEDTSMTPCHPAALTSRANKSWIPRMKKERETNSWVMWRTTEAFYLGCDVAVTCMLFVQGWICSLILSILSNFYDKRNACDFALTSLLQVHSPFPYVDNMIDFGDVI